MTGPRDLAARSRARAEGEGLIPTATSSTKVFAPSFLCVCLCLRLFFGGGGSEFRERMCSTVCFARVLGASSVPFASSKVCELFV